MQTPTYPTNIKSLQDKTAMTCWMLTVCVTQTNAGRFAHVEQISGIDTQCLESVPWSHKVDAGQTKGHCQGTEWRGAPIAKSRLTATPSLHSLCDDFQARPDWHEPCEGKPVACLDVENPDIAHVDIEQPESSSPQHPSPQSY